MLYIIGLLWKTSNIFGGNVRREEEFVQDRCPSEFYLYKVNNGNTRTMYSAHFHHSLNSFTYKHLTQQPNQTSPIRLFIRVNGRKRLGLVSVILITSYFNLKTNVCHICKYRQDLNDSTLLNHCLFSLSASLKQFYGQKLNIIFVSIIY